jgi:hypothetical protein
MSPLHRAIAFGILFVALISGIWFIHNGGITRSGESPVTLTLPGATISMASAITRPPFAADASGSRVGPEGVMLSG